MSDKNKSELYAIALNHHNPKFYGRVPATIFRATYLVTKDGVTTRHKLSANAIALYAAISQISGQSSVCWASGKSLGDLISRSSGAVSSAKQELMQPIEQLGGKAFITVQKKKKRHKDKPGSTEYHEISCNHIWPESNAFMEVLRDEEYPLGVVENQGAVSDIEIVEAARSDIETVTQGALSYIETNNNPLNNTPPVNEEQPTASGPVCHLSGSDSVIGNHKEEVAIAIAQMASFGCDETFIKEMTSRFDPMRIRKAGVYTLNQMKRRKVPNKFGYLRRAIENGYTWK